MAKKVDEKSSISKKNLWRPSKSADVSPNTAKSLFTFQIDKTYKELAENSLKKTETTINQCQQHINNLMNVDIPKNLAGSFTLDEIMGTSSIKGKSGSINSQLNHLKDTITKFYKAIKLTSSKYENLNVSDDYKFTTNDMYWLTMGTKTKHYKDVSKNAKRRDKDLEKLKEKYKFKEYTDEELNEIRNGYYFELSSKKRKQWLKAHPELAEKLFNNSIYNYATEKNGKTLILNLLSLGFYRKNIDYRTLEEYTSVYGNEKNGLLDKSGNMHIEGLTDNTGVKMYLEESTESINIGGDIIGMVIPVEAGYTAIFKTAAKSVGIGGRTVSAGIRIEGTVAKKLVREGAEEVASKSADDVFRFVAKNGDDAVEIIAKEGDDVLKVGSNGTRNIKRGRTTMGTKAVEEVSDNTTKVVKAGALKHVPSEAYAETGAKVVKTVDEPVFEKDIWEKDPVLKELSNQKVESVNETNFNYEKYDIKLKESNIKNEDFSEINNKTDKKVDDIDDIVNKYLQDDYEKSDSDILSNRNTNGKKEINYHEMAEQKQFERERKQLAAQKKQEKNIKLEQQRLEDERIEKQLEEILKDQNIENRNSKKLPKEEIKNDNLIEFPKEKEIEIVTEDQLLQAANPVENPQNSRAVIDSTNGKTNQPGEEVLKTDNETLRELKEIKINAEKEIEKNQSLLKNSNLSSSEREVYEKQINDIREKVLNKCDEEIKLLEEKLAANPVEKEFQKIFDEEYNKLANNDISNKSLKSESYEKAQEFIDNHPGVKKVIDYAQEHPKVAKGTTVVGGLGIGHHVGSAIDDSIDANASDGYSAPKSTNVDSSTNQTSKTEETPNILYDNGDNESVEENTYGSYDTGNNESTEYYSSPYGGNSTSKKTTGNSKSSSNNNTNKTTGGDKNTSKGESTKETIVETPNTSKEESTKETVVETPNTSKEESTKDTVVETPNTPSKKVENKPISNTNQSSNDHKKSTSYKTESINNQTNDYINSSNKNNDDKVTLEVDNNNFNENIPNEEIENISDFLENDNGVNSNENNMIEGKINNTAERNDQINNNLNHSGNSNNAKINPAIPLGVAGTVGLGGLAAGLAIKNKKEKDEMKESGGSMYE